ncbi:MAG: phenylalanine--tRNA ligase subunit beta [Nitrospirae bacterium YQR-1]
MLLPFNWLSDFLEITEPPQSVSSLLTMAGLEVEALYGQGSDAVLEVNVTPNRGDCLSVLGLARELSAITGRPLKLKDSCGSVEAGTAAEEISVEIIDTELCRRYSGEIISGVKVTQSPQWLIKRLEAAGVRAINNIVDVTNYVLIELGQPLHAFDLSKLRGNTIRVKRADGAVKIRALDGVERTVSGDSLLIWDSEGPVAIAGVMGGQGSEVAADTVDIFLESAWFLPESIRKTSKALGLRSESSYRFERATDIGGTVRALNRTAELIVELCGGAAMPVIDIYPVKYKPAEIEFKRKSVTKLLGMDISEDTISSILVSLGFSVSGSGGIYRVTVPSHRTDIELEADLTEEIARIYGYNNIPSVMPHACVSAKVSSHKEMSLRPIGNLLRQAGFTETINYSFMPEDALDILLIPQGDERRKTVEVLNPLSKEESVLRTFLLPALIENLRLNLNFRQKEIHLFEAGTVFINEGGKLPVESFNLSIVSLSGVTQKLWSDNAHIFYKLKGITEALRDTLRLSGMEFSKDGVSVTPSEEPFLSRTHSVDIYLKGKRAGYLGLLSPEVTNNLGLKIQRPEVGVAELFLDEVFKSELLPQTFMAMPKYPPIERDMAVVVDMVFAAAEMVKLIRGYDSNLIESVEIFDSYTGKSVGEGKKSLACHIVYRAADRTLTDKEIDDLHGAVVNHVLEMTGGVLRS